MEMNSKCKEHRKAMVVRAPGNPENSHLSVPLPEDATGLEASNDVD